MVMSQESRVNVGIQEVCEESGLTQISVADEDDTLRWSD